MKARRLAALRRVLVASPDYLARHGRPEGLDDHPPRIFVGAGCGDS
jgi:DNA-binding transcriptional LysR family regulator